MKNINVRNSKNWYKSDNQKLNKIGNKNVNSISYSIRKTHIIIKLILICILISDIDLKPHS